jgi:hypothetical protein
MNNDQVIYFISWICLGIDMYLLIKNIIRKDAILSAVCMMGSLILLMSIIKHTFFINQ